MLTKLIRTFNCVLLLVLLMAGRTEAQDSFPLDWNLSQLRGSWQFHTYRDKWTMVFDCDHKMLFDREAADYTLTPGLIRIEGSDGVVEYPYTLAVDELSLTLPDGGQRTYRRTDPGEAEQLVHGVFYGPGNSSASRERISFDGDRSFALQTFPPAQAGGPVEQKGIYRVEGEVIVLAFEDSTILETQVHARGDDSTLTSLVLTDRLFAIEEPVTAASPPPVQLPAASAPPLQTDLVPLYGVPEPPPAYSISAPAPVGTGTAATPDKKDTKAKDPQRKFGTTRGKDDGR
jgi:hypothetical protein